VRVYNGGGVSYERETNSEGLEGVREDKITRKENEKKEKYGINTVVSVLCWVFYV
jgi:hypothetical protein